MSLCGFSTACEDPPREPKDAVPSYVVETTRVPLRLELESPTAFAFAPRSDGATLVWAAPTSKKQIQKLRLSRGGSALGGPSVVVQNDTDGGLVTDLVATPVANGLAVAWVERLKNEARLRAALYDGRQAASAFDLGPAWHTNKTVRGNVAVARDRDQALVFARGQSEACVSPGERECFGFSLHRIAEEASQARGLPLSVPVPCDQNSAHLRVENGGWFYGVCTVSDGERVTTLFDIQFNPEYARAERLLPGCQPLGIVVRNSKPWLVGRCGDKRLGVKLPAGKGKPVDLGATSLSCLGRKLRLNSGASAEPLEAGRTDLGPLLPADLTEKLEQAVYTGTSLLLARGEGKELLLVRHACVPRGSKQKN